MLGNVHLLVLEICYWQLDVCVLVLLMPGWILLNPNTIKQSHLVLAPTQICLPLSCVVYSHGTITCCSFRHSHFSWMVPAVNMWHAWAKSHRSLHLPSSAMKTCPWNTQFLLKHGFIFYTLLLSFLHSLPCLQLNNPFHDYLCYFRQIKLWPFHCTWSILCWLLLVTSFVLACIYCVTIKIQQL